MKAIFLPGASPINNKSSTFLYRLLLKAWFETRLYRCKQIIVGKEACTVSCLWGLWNTCFDNGASMVQPAWHRSALAGHPWFTFPLCITALQSYCPRPTSLLYRTTKCMAWLLFFQKVFREGVFGSASLCEKKTMISVHHTLKIWLMDEDTLQLQLAIAVLLQWQSWCG